MTDKHRLQALVVQGRCAFRHRRLRRGYLVCLIARCVLCQQTAQRFSRKTPLALQVARDNEVFLWMSTKPALAALQELFDLVIGYPVVLFIVENRNQHIEVREQDLAAALYLR